MDESAPRRAWVTIVYAGRDITESVSNSVVSFSFTDKASGEADSLDLTVLDKEGRWASDWYPKVRSGCGNNGG